MRSRVLAGLLSADYALQQLLAGTDLKAKRSSSGVIVIEKGASGAGEDQQRDDSSVASQGESSDIDQEDAPEIEVIVVTGTRIRGQKPVGSNVITIGRAEIDRSGFVTVQDVVRALPQNLRGGVSDFLTGGQSQLPGLGARGLRRRALGLVHAGHSWIGLREKIRARAQRQSQ